MKDIQQKLLATFAIEHREHVEQIRSLLALMENTSQTAGAELEEVFRRAHSLKGAARAVDLAPIEGLAHRLETLFARARRGECVLSGDVTRVVLQVLDATEDCIGAEAQANGGPESVAAALRAIDGVLGVEVPTSPPDLIKFPISGAPVTGVPAPGAPATSAPVRRESAAPAYQPLETLRVTAQNFDGIFRSAGGLITETQRQADVAETLEQLGLQISQLCKEGKRARQFAARARDAAANPESAPGEFARLASSLDSVERRAHSLSRHLGVTRRLQHRHSWRLRQLGRQLQEEMEQARLVPAESLLDGLRKMIRDLARSEGKEIDFRSSGAHVSADRRVLEALKDPLRHILRNAVSHGIEDPAERMKRGKAPTGFVAIHMEATGGHLLIEVEDDGRGIDLDRVAAVAVRDGLIPEGDTAQRSPQALYQMLLRPGFSTASAVTNLAGRGMGLSVVDEAIRRLQGDLTISAGARGGAKIAFSVPLSIASHRLMIVACGGQKFAIPLLGIERLHRMPRAKVETAEGKPVVTLDGRMLPLASLHGLLGIEPSANTPTTSTNPDILQLVLLHTGGERAAIAVDAILQEADAAIQDLGSAAALGGRISSGVVLEDGSVALVVQPMELIRGSRQAQGGLRLLPPPPKAPAAQITTPSILVVDDSMTTRTLEKTILEAHGYNVRVAVDGVDALMRLRQEQADLVIADIEMPRLNGFGLIEAMKKDAALERIPVIIVSSLEKREDRERGLSLGADAYIIKRKFDQEDLLAAIRQIL